MTPYRHPDDYRALCAAVDKRAGSGWKGVKAP